MISNVINNYMCFKIVGICSSNSILTFANTAKIMGVILNSY